MLELACVERLLVNNANIGLSLKSPEGRLVYSGTSAPGAGKILSKLTEVYLRDVRLLASEI